MSNEQNKDLKVSIAVIVALSVVCGIILASMTIVIVAFAVASDAVIVDRDGTMNKVRICTIVGDTVIITAKSDPSKTRDGLEGIELSPDVAFLSSGDIARIEFIAPVQPAPEQKPEKAAVTLPPVTGVYDVTVTGYKGTLAIAQKDGYLYGYIQFPGWAHGVKEPLKNIRISGGRLLFTRSVDNAKELKRVGASSLFVQNFEADILDGGRHLGGKFTNHGVKDSWDAFRR